MKSNIKEFLKDMAICGVAFAVVMHIHSVLNGTQKKPVEKKSPRIEQVDSVSKKIDNVKKRAIIETNTKTK